MQKAIFNWSGGKDSAMALLRCRQEGRYEICCLLTSVSSEFRRVSQHGVRESLLNEQAGAIGIELFKLEMPSDPSMSDYNTLMRDALLGLKKYHGISTSVFGDIFLRDLRKYREEQLMSVGFDAIFPLWLRPTDKLAEEFIDFGFKAVVVCVDERYLDKSFAGREFDPDFIKDLPENVDPCGENGEFHTFVYDGPVFQHPVTFRRGGLVYRKYQVSRNDTSACPSPPLATGFWYCDLLPRYPHLRKLL